MSSAATHGRMRVCCPLQLGVRRHLESAAVSAWVDRLNGVRNEPLVILVPVPLLNARQPQSLTGDLAAYERVLPIPGVIVVMKAVTNTSTGLGTQGEVPGVVAHALLVSDAKFIDCRTFKHSLSGGRIEARPRI